MGRNAQKRLARKLRDDGGADDTRSARSASGPTSAHAGADVAFPPERPAWLSGTIAATSTSTSQDPLLDLAVAVLRQAPLDELARMIADALPAEEVALEIERDALAVIDGEKMGVDGPSTTRGLAKRPGQEGVPGIEALVRGLALDGGALVIENVASDPRLPLAMGARGRVGSLVVVPLEFAHHSNARVGFLACARREVAGFPQRDIEVLAAMGDLIAQDIVQARALRVAFTDPLTGALSRQTLIALVEREVERARRRNTPLAALVFDIDGLREKNAREGRAQGDAHIVDIASKLAVFARGGELFGRLGADRFLILIEASASEIEPAARRLLDDVLRDPVRENGADQHMTASIGAAMLGPQEQTGAFLRRAQGALAAAKAAGGATVAIADQESLEIPRADDEGH